MDSSTVEKTEVKTTSTRAVETTLLVITFRVAFILTMVGLAAATIFVVFALIGGATSAGDPLSMIREWFKAVSGN